MKKSILISCLACCASLSWAEQIVLKDGSSINGEVISLQGGNYSIRTESLGMITLPQGQVRSISQVSSPVAPADAGSTGQSAVQSLQSTITSDPGLMAGIMRLQSDPDMQAVLNDPELMRAIQAFDLETLRNHPKIQKLMNNSTVQVIQDKVN